MDGVGLEDASAGRPAQLGVDTPSDPKAKGVTLVATQDERGNANVLAYARVSSGIACCC